MERSGYAGLSAALALVLGFSASAGAVDWKDLPDPGGDGGQSKDDAGKKRPLVIEEQGAFAFAGTVLGDPETESVHCDHGYVEYQIPPHARELPLMMWHSSSTKTWETTFANEDGFKNIFLRRGFSVYIFDPPRLGRAGWGCEEWTYVPDLGRDQAQITSWRLGIWTPPDPPEFFPNVQFPVDDPEAIDEVLRARYPEFNEPENEQLETDAVAELLDQVGPSVLLTHSGSGIRGWWTALKSENVKAIVAYEPGDFIAPEGDEPTPEDGPQLVSSADFDKLTEIPIQIIYGDNIPTEPTGLPGRDNWLEAVANAEDFVEEINARGGDAELLMLPDLGIYGNTHFPMSDLNNAEIADLLSKFLHEKGLDRRGHRDDRSASR
jgi:hypothetical protein